MAKFPSQGPKQDPNEPETESGWLAGYTASDPKAADTENSNMRYYAPGEAAVGYKKVWKDRPCVFPNGEGDEGSL